MQGSIRKWESIVYGGGIDRGGDNCPLCKLFLDGWCDGCPVKGATGDSHCNGTPYSTFIWAWEDAVGHDEADEAFVLDDATHNAAKAELAFLKRLLPDA